MLFYPRYNFTVKTTLFYTNSGISRSLESNQTKYYIQCLSYSVLISVKVSVNLLTCTYLTFNNKCYLYYLFQAYTQMIMGYVVFFLSISGVMMVVLFLVNMEDEGEVNIILAVCILSGICLLFVVTIISFITMGGTCCKCEVYCNGRWLLECEK